MSSPSRVRKRDKIASFFKGSATVLHNVGSLLLHGTPALSKEDEYKSQQWLDVLSKDTIDIERVRNLSKQGVPADFRAIVWEILLGYIPLNTAEREVTLERKRNTYKSYIDTYYNVTSLPTLPEEKITEIKQQIQVDVLRTSVEGYEPLFSHPKMQQLLCRILFIYSIRYHSGNYWQGLNELPSPFVIAFLSLAVRRDALYLQQFPPSALEQVLANGHIEADIYWCLASFVQGLQSKDYVVTKSGAVTPHKILARYSILLEMVNVSLFNHLNELGIQPIFYAFRWMVCLLSRELSLPIITRMWDCYIAEGFGISSFHCYVCVAFIEQFSAQLLRIDSFEDALIFLQNLPTKHWNEAKSIQLLRRAYEIKALDEYYTQTATVCVASILATMVVLTAIYSVGSSNRLTD